MLEGGEGQRSGTLLSPQQPVQPRRLLRRIEAFEHPDIVRPFSDGCEEALAVGMQTEPVDAALIVWRRRIPVNAATPRW